ncbi:MAG TPA: thiamine pyrophosphate-dependent enzyme [Steroidobacteraceae bacterium]|nr:thiamine pyrophosphate-dependent enzyme [Steroidobacteraceae bacterium]
MATRTAADVLIDTLCDWGVQVVFGLPGDGINGIMEALRRRQDRVRFVQVRHEESAAFMACAYAKLTGKLGVCLATSGPGGVHLLNGLYDAKLDGQPVLAITGLQYHDLLHTMQQQDVELDKLYMDVAVYNSRVMGPAHVRNVTELACRAALAYRGVAHVTVPKDMQDLSVQHDERSKRNVPGHGSDVFAPIPRLPDEAGLQRAADVLNAGKRIVIMAGRGAIGAGAELEETANRLGAVIVKPLLGKAAVPDDSPFTTGSVGLVGTKPSQEALERCDTLFIVGSSFPYIEFYPEPGQARAVQIDIDPLRIGLRYPIEVALVGDALATLRHLLPLLKRNENRDFLTSAQKGMAEWRERMQERATRRDKPMKPQVVAHELGRLLRNDAIFTADSGTAATWYARHIPVRAGQMCTLSGNLATMANGFPYAIAAQIAYPERQCVAFVGDGAFTMLMGDFVTCVKYKLPVKVVILKNNSLGQIKWEQIGMEGNPEFGCDLQPIDFAAFARACGGVGYTIDDPAACGSMLERALNEPGPVVIEAVIDPNEPPLPPKITFEQAKNFAEALARGTAERGKIALTVMSDKVRELI